MVGYKLTPLKQRGSVMAFFAVVISFLSFLTWT